jgi:hypothetical protein
VGSYCGLGLSHRVTFTVHFVWFLRNPTHPTLPVSKRTAVPVSRPTHKKGKDRYRLRMGM